MPLLKYIVSIENKGIQLSQSTLENIWRQIFKSSILAGYFYLELNTLDIKTFTLRFTSKPVKQMRRSVSIVLT